MPARRAAARRLSCLLLSATAWAQRPPPFSVPDTIPADLQVDGEWWFYSLLDSQFPHDVLTPLPESAVASASSASGTPQFLSLPEAEYLLLEFFAPWCPHCQHFAPEMVKVVQSTKGLQGPSGMPLVAVRTVDCEKLSMTALCNWGDANLMPRLAFGRRESFMGQLAPLAAQTPGLQVLFPVSDAQTALSWMQKQAPEWPPSAPTAAPVDAKTPFFGWSQPVEGIVEPPQAPSQDIEVAVASLLHEAFSSLDVTPEKKAALLDLLQLLCAVGPGGAGCRSSACEMRQGLQQQWDSLLQVITVDRTAQGQPMPPTTFHYLDWARVESSFRWCHRPWPDFAQESWDWCRGRTPGTRGYPCGLWMLFHGLLAGAALGGAAPPKPPLEVVRSTVSAFFGCADCRQHFLSVPVTPEDLASPKAQVLWLWNAHNLATQRVAAEEQKFSSAAPVREQWPTLSACPQCRLGDGSHWDVEAVYNHILQFYSPAFDSGAPPPAPQNPLGGLPKLLKHLTGKYEQPPAATVPVSVEVYYYTLCPHCEQFLKLGLRPLVEAKLPGSQVQVTLLPVYPPLLQWLKDRSLCEAHEDCFTSLAPLCALRAAGSMPAAADSPPLLAGANFAACALSASTGGRGRDPEAVRPCADAAGVDFGQLQACVAGPEAMTLLGNGARSLERAMALLHFKTGYQDPPSMPWVFLNGELLLCEDGQSCTAVQTPQAMLPLPNPGSLLAQVCSRLGAQQPASCSREQELVQAALNLAYQEAGGRVAQQAAAKKAADCENCFEEVGALKWQAPQGGSRLSPGLTLLAATAAVACGAVALRAMALRPGASPGLERHMYLPTNADE